MFSSQNSQVSSAANYIEDCFSTYLYTGNGSTQTITNGIDLSGKGGLVWIKKRSGGTADSHNLYDTGRGATKRIKSNLTDASVTTATSLTSFNSDGFSLGSSTASNESPNPYVSWTFRKQPKFFDVVTYTGNSVAGRTVAHNLGSVPGSIIVKETSAANDWLVYHRNDGTTAQVGLLNSTQATFNNSGDWFGDGTSAVPPTSTEFTVSTSSRLNQSGQTYVAYLFAHNAGGFGLTGTDNVISCGSYTGGGASAVSVNLGYEAQWLLVRDTAGGNWYMFDNMRGVPTPSSSNTATLKAESTAAEVQESAGIFTATGFSATSSTTINANGSTYIYIAIRRGPMKVPTSGTSVFAPISGSYSIGNTNTTGFPVDLQIARKLTVNSSFPIDRLRGISSTSSTNATWLKTDTTDAENTSSGFNYSFDNTKYLIGSNFTAGAVYWNFRRAPSFFDEVCYTGTGVATNFTHNLGVVPDLWIIKNRVTAATSWHVGGNVFPTPTSARLLLNDTSADLAVANTWQTPTSTTFGIGTTYASNAQFNASGSTYVAYLFATCAGVSKVGSYTGTGTTKQVDCGFTGGARFVLIKRTDSTGAWYVWDSARGIVAGNDPYLLLNSTAAEVTNTDYIDTYSAGFEISSTAPAAINASGGTFIFLAIA